MANQNVLTYPSFDGFGTSGSDTESASRYGHPFDIASARLAGRPVAAIGYPQPLTQQQPMQAAAPTASGFPAPFTNTPWGRNQALRWAANPYAQGKAAAGFQSTFNNALAANAYQAALRYPDRLPNPAAHGWDGRPQGPGEDHLAGAAPGIPAKSAGTMTIDGVTRQASGPASIPGFINAPITNGQPFRDIATGGYWTGQDRLQGAIGAGMARANAPVAIQDSRNAGAATVAGIRADASRDVATTRVQPAMISAIGKQQEIAAHARFLGVKADQLAQMTPAQVAELDARRKRELAEADKAAKQTQSMGVPKPATPGRPGRPMLIPGAVAAPDLEYNRQQVRDFNQHRTTPDIGLPSPATQPTSQPNSTTLPGLGAPGMVPQLPGQPGQQTRITRSGTDSRSGRRVNQYSDGTIRYEDGTPYQE